MSFIRGGEAARAGHRTHGRLRGHPIRGRRPVLVETVPAPGVAPPPAPTSRRCRCATSPIRDPPIGSCSSRGFPGYWQPVGPIVLSRQYLALFGRFRIPAPLWQALGQYACRLDPVIVRDWRQLTANRDSTANRHSATKWGATASDNAMADRDDAAEGGPATDDAFEWTESRYDTREALERAKQVRDGGYALTCVWSASRIRSSPHID